MRLWLAVVLLLVIGLSMALRPAATARQDRWRFRDSANLEPSRLYVAVIRLFGIIFTGSAILLALEELLKS